MQDFKAIIDRYIVLRKDQAALDGIGEALMDRANIIDAELVELERQLPANYHYPGDVPL